MIAAAQGSQAECKHFWRNSAVGLVKASQGISGHCACQAMRLGAHFHSGRDFRLGNAVEFRQVDAFFFQICCQHPAANINAYQIRNHLIAYGHRCSNHTPRPGVTIRHDPNLGALNTRLIQQVGYLCYSRLIAAICKYLSGIKPALDDFHCPHL